MEKLEELEDILEITMYLVLEGLMVRCLEWSQEDRRSILDWICDESGVSL